MKTVLITGANRGIGLALAHDYITHGWHVIAVCRKTSVELSETPAQVIAGVDVTSTSDVQALAEQLTGIKIDLLINNAGILHSDHLGHRLRGRYQRRCRPEDGPLTSPSNC